MHLPKIGYPRIYCAVGFSALKNKFNNIQNQTHLLSTPKKVNRFLPTAIIVAKSLCLSMPGNIANASVPIRANFMPQKNIHLPKHTVADSFGGSTSNKKYYNQFFKNSCALDAHYPASSAELDKYIDSFLSKAQGDKKDNPLYKKGSAFIKISKKHKVNPSLLVAIAMQESGRGTSEAARLQNNIGGIISKETGGLMTFKSIEGCINSMAYTIRKRRNEQIISIDQLAQSGKYCDKSVAEKWTEHVLFFLNKM